MFDFAEEAFEAPGLTLRAHLAPWDRPVLGHETAAIREVELRDPATAEPAWEAFRAWCDRHAVALVAARLPHRSIAECGFLEARGFRFVELLYRPTLRNLAPFRPDPEMLVERAGPEDEAEARAIAERVFETGRLHMDPMVGPELGNRRYAAWIGNSFRHPRQTVMKCTLGGRIAALFVVEETAPDRRFWPLGLISPAFAGQGVGRRSWSALIAHQAREGVTVIETNISTLNNPVLNLYVSLGFRFPEPHITLHWCPRGPLAAGA